MALAIKLADDSNPDRLPVGWPIRAKEIGNVTELPPECPPEDGWVLSDHADLQARKDALTAEYAAWEAANAAAEEAEAQAMQDIDRGRSIIGALAADMTRLQWTDAEKGNMVGAMHDVLILLQSGQIRAAKEIVKKAVAAGNVSEEMLTKLKQFMERQ